MKSNEKRNIFIWVLVLILLSDLLMIIVATTIFNTKYEQLNAGLLEIQEILESNDLTSERISETYEDLIGDTRVGELNIIDSAISNVRESNSYLAVYNQDTDTPAGVVLYNENGECAHQSDDDSIMIYLNDNRCVYFSSDGVSGSNDVDVLKQALCSIRLAKEYDNIDIKKEIRESGLGYIEYLVDIHGYNDVQKYLSVVGTEYGKQMAEAIKNSLLMTELKENEDYEKLNVRYSVALDDTTGQLNGVSCYYYFGEESDAGYGEWKNCYLIWSLVYGGNVGEWKLQDGWYEFDYDSMNEDTVNVLVNMLSELDEQISQLGDSFVETDVDLETWQSDTD